MLQLVRISVGNFALNILRKPLPYPRADFWIYHHLLFQFLYWIQIVSPGYGCCQVIQITQSLSPSNKAVPSPTPAPVPSLTPPSMLRGPKAEEHKHPPHTHTHTFLFVGLVFYRISSLNFIEMSGQSRESSRRHKENMARSQGSRGNRRAELPLQLHLATKLNFLVRPRAAYGCSGLSFPSPLMV